MNPWKVSAQFAAFIWYSNRNAEKETAATLAADFAKENWIAFLPYAHEGYGRLLIKIAQPRTTNGMRRRIGNSANRRKVSRSNTVVVH